jgi:hypothetical protein
MLNDPWPKRSASRNEGPMIVSIDNLQAGLAWFRNKWGAELEAITAAGLRLLPVIAQEFSGLRSSSVEEPNITHVDWEQVERLFSLASSIKPGSPVFPSKLTHFIFPKLFIVVDNKATGVSEYEIYWRGMKDAWSRFPEKNRAIDILTRPVECDRPLHSGYPIETKIMEICQIGNNYPEPSIIGGGQSHGPS